MPVINIEGRKIECKNFHAFKMGVLAFKISMGREENPWKNDPEIFSDWDKGWEEAEILRSAGKTDVITYEREV